MHILIGTLLTACACGVFADRTSELNSIYARWQKSQRGMQSLVVEFTMEASDAVFNTPEKSHGVFRFLRTPKGAIHASYEINPRVGDTNPDAVGQPSHYRYVLHQDGEGTVVSILDLVGKTESRGKLANKDLLDLLEDYFNPLAVFLDRQRLEKNCNLEVSRDSHYSYVLAKPKHAKPRTGWFLLFPLDFAQARVVMMNGESKDIPNGAPCQLWMRTGNRQVTFRIESWRVNPADGPTPQEFTEATNRPGWRVIEEEWPSASKGAGQPRK